MVMEEDIKLTNVVTEPKPKLSRLRRAARTDPQEPILTASEEIAQKMAQHPSAVEASEAAGLLSNRSRSEGLKLLLPKTFPKWLETTGNCKRELQGYLPSVLQVSVESGVGRLNLQTDAKLRKQALSPLLRLKIQIVRKARKARKLTRASLGSTTMRRMSSWNTLHARSSDSSPSKVSEEAVKSESPVKK